MSIQWNAVTRYSKLFALIVFVVTFFLAFSLGILWGQTSTRSISTSTGIPTGETDSASHLECGSGMPNAPTCPEGYHCQLGVIANVIANTSGVCVHDTIIASTTTQIPSDMLTVTAQDQNTTVHLTKNERFAITFGDLAWSLAFSPASSIARVANTLSTDGYQGVYEANQAGTVLLTAEGRPICKPKQACPMFIQSIHITFVVTP